GGARPGGGGPRQRYLQPRRHALRGADRPAPFRSADLVELQALVLRAEPAPPRALNPQCARDLETICLKCLHKEPARRYPSALELAEDLRRYLDGQPIRARRVGAAERAGKWVRRHPTTTALAVVSLVAAIASAFALTLRGALDEAETGYGKAREVVDDVCRFGEHHLRD